MFEEFILANKFKNYCMSELSRASFVPLKTNCPNVFAYARGCSNYSVIVIGNLDFKNAQNKVIINAPSIKHDENMSVITGDENIKSGYHKLFADLILY